MTGDFDKIIGSAPECDIQVRKPGIDGRHARIHRRGDHIFIEHLGGASETTVNGVSLGAGAWKEVTRTDVLRLGRLRLELGDRLFEGRPRLDLGSERLWWKTPDGRMLCEGSWVRAAPGSLTAIMGPSGCGKSVLLSLLSGQQKADRGGIFYREVSFAPETDDAGRELIGPDGQRLMRRLPGRTLGLPEDRDELGPVIGFVPQAEILIPELTVRQSLDHRLRLRYPTMGPGPRTEIMRRVVESLGFRGERAEKFLTTRIGHPEERGQVLSGGERRRANIAHELVLQPLVLFLDEPTSGLSSVDTAGVIEMLQRIAREERIAILATVHQPSQEVFARFDSLLLLGLGGKMLYHGPASQAVPMMQRLLGCRWADENPAELVLRVQEDGGALQTLASAAESGWGAAAFAPLDRATVAGGAAETKREQHGASRAAGKPSWWWQWWLMVSRGLRVTLTDRLGLLATFGQVPLIALLLAIALAGAEQTHGKGDQIGRFVQAMVTRDTQANPLAEPLRASDIKRIAQEAVQDNGKVCEARARQRAVGYFVLGLAAIWFGLIGSVREVVSEQALVRRECRALVSPFAYLAAKFSVQALLTLIQVVGLMGLALVALPGLSWSGAITTTGLLWLAALAAVALGLLVSCTASTYRAALGLVPLLVIPQVLFGGLLRPFQGVEVSQAQLIGAATVQRWVFAAMLEQDQLAKGGVIQVNLEDNRDIGSLMELVRMFGYRENRLPDLFFAPSPSHTQAAVLVLPGFCCVWLGTAALLLRRRVQL